jgi:serine/threonine protein kinase
MGEVYRAHDPRLGRDVALKLLSSALMDDPAGLARFAREARTVAALNHPHIVTIHSTEEVEGVRFLTMELVDGHTLDEQIPPGGLPLRRVLDIALPLADALMAAHQRNIAHRDLKPANVMVTTDGRVKVLDFGLACVASPSGAPASEVHQNLSGGDAPTVSAPPVTIAGTMIGTMPYMSPEQVEGRPLDHRTNLFSLGVMFHEMLTGARPFRADTPVQLLSSILRDDPPPVGDTRAGLPDALSDLIQRCLEKRPDDRVQTARDGGDQGRRGCCRGTDGVRRDGPAVRGTVAGRGRAGSRRGADRGHRRRPVAVQLPACREAECARRQHCCRIPVAGVRPDRGRRRTCGHAVV